ncbi:MAG: nucleotidyltransferase family protein [Candidatus Kerfeldbacteria bacterium]|nr:nucleotidyltransferase family protein [Candidatus Kerfeldbacteria bacterium]
MVESTDNINTLLTSFLRSRGVSLVGIFGSYTRGEANENSDIDLLVRFTNPKSLFEIIKIEQDLSYKLGRRIDLVTESALHPYLRPKVFKDLKIVYGSR